MRCWSCLAIRAQDFVLDLLALAIANEHVVPFYPAVHLLAEIQFSRRASSRDLVMNVSEMNRIDKLIPCASCAFRVRLSLPVRDGSG